MEHWYIEPLAKDHVRSDFSSGNPPLDEFLRVRVSQYERRNIGKTFVVVSPAKKSGKLVLGYYTLASGAVSFEQLPSESARKLPKHPVPVVLLARLAVDQAYQGKGLGEGLLFDALRRSLALSADLGIYAVTVEAMNDSAAFFYVRYGFTPLLNDHLHLHLPIATIDKIFNK